MLKTRHDADGTAHPVHLRGWKRQSTDVRDEAFRLRLPAGILKVQATSADLRSICSPIEDQGDLGSCTAHMLAGLVEANEHVTTKKVSFLATNTTVSISNVMTAADGTITYTTTVKPASAPVPVPTPTPTPTPTPAPSKLIRASRLFEYYASRKIEGTINEDSGASIRDAIKAAAQYGVVDESLWSYDITKFTVNPPQAIWTAAATHKVTSYHSITDGDLVTMKNALLSNFLVGFGFQVYDYMMSAAMAKQAFLPLPGRNESLQGGHAVCLAGFDDNMANPFNAASRGAFLVRNSWGIGWGQSGYFWISYDYVKNTSLASDFWVVQSAPIG